jgi:hypothetical protein
LLVIHQEEGKKSGFTTPQPACVCACAICAPLAPAHEDSALSTITVLLFAGDVFMCVPAAVRVILRLFFNSTFLVSRD